MVNCDHGKKGLKYESKLFYELKNFKQSLDRIILKGNRIRMWGKNEIDT